MKHDIFTRRREYFEAEQGLVSKEEPRKQLQADVDAFLANGGTITVCESTPAKEEKRLTKKKKQTKLSDAEISRRLKEFAETGTITIQ